MSSAAPSLTPAQAREIATAFLDHPRFCRESLSIPDKRGVIVPLEQTPAQLKVTKLVQQLQRKGVPVRIRCLKARQVHNSVGIATHVFKACAFLPAQKAEVWCNTDDNTVKLYRYFKHFDEHYKPFMGLKKLKRTAISEGDYIQYEGEGGITFHTAGGRGGRGGSCKVLLLSETAFPAWNPEIRTGLLQQVPLLLDTMIFDESTANGMGGDFYAAWKACEDPNNKSGWYGTFFGWQEHPEYVLPVEDGHAFERSLTDEEHTIRNLYNLTPEQLNWRRYTISTTCEGDPRRFQQEYPANAEEAFLTSGRPRFDMTAVARMPISDAPIAGELEEATVGLKQVVRLRPSSDGTGPVRIWRMPDARHRYVIGADTAEGKDAKKGKGTADPDFTALVVIDRDTLEQVATVRVRQEPAASAQYCWALMRFYNRAFLCFEINNTGIAFRDELLRQNVPGELLYSDPDSTDAVGFRTTVVTRQRLISGLDIAITEGQLTIHDPRIVHELRVFVYRPDNKVAAQDGEHDDLVFGIGLAWQAILRYPATLEAALTDGNRPGVTRYQTKSYGRRSSEPEGWND